MVNSRSSVSHPLPFPSLESSLTGIALCGLCANAHIAAVEDNRSFILTD